MTTTSRASVDLQAREGRSRVVARVAALPITDVDVLAVGARRDGGDGRVAADLRVVSGCRARRRHQDQSEYDETDQGELGQHELVLHGILLDPRGSEGSWGHDGTLAVASRAAVTGRAISRRHRSSSTRRSEPALQCRRVVSAGRTA